MSHPIGVSTHVDNLGLTGELPAASYTELPKSTTRAAATTDHPQSTHNQTRLPRWSDMGSSPMRTSPNTVACISLKILLRRSSLGTFRTPGRQAARPPSMSARSISFQVEAESSTVVHRQPLRSSQRIAETRGETPGSRWLELVVVLIEGTLWTWRQQPLVSPI